MLRPPWSPPGSPRDSSTASRTPGSRSTPAPPSTSWSDSWRHPVTADEMVETLRSAGVRITRPRRAICEALVSSGTEHVDIATLAKRASELVDDHLDVSTVYRTVDLLEEHGLAHHVHLGHSGSIVHMAQERHHHLACEVCGRTVDVPLSEIGGLSDLLQRHQFGADSVHFAVVGRCKVHE
ncbi:MAG: hypothetical protein GEU79_06565 [Acidimicrobiia bacterium]|nr:hypothetical protein [Acidimicrobiia bacterium]